jgi:hypothetical protein
MLDGSKIKFRKMWHMPYKSARAKTAAAYEPRSAGFMPPEVRQKSQEETNDVTYS